MRKCAALVLMLSLLAARSFGQDGIAAEIRVARPEVYVNEIFDLIVTIDATGITLAKEMGMSGFPEKDRLLLWDFQEIQPERRVENNQVRDMRPFRCRARMPQAGELDFAPILRVKVMSRQEGVVGFMWIERHQEIKVPPLKLKAVALPEQGKSADFSGAIGKLTFDVEASPTDVAVGDLITLRMTVKGDGYLESIKPPRLKAGPNLKTYDPEAVTKGVPAGTLMFEQTVIPQNADATEIPVISFTYLDTDARAYRTITRGPFALKFHQQKTVVHDQYRPKQGSGVSTSSVVSQAGIPAVHEAEERGGFTARVLALFRSGHPAKTVRAESVMFAPAASASVSFDLPAAADVVVLATHGNWSKIESGAKRGWIPSVALNAGSNKNN